MLEEVLVVRRIPTSDSSLQFDVSNWDFFMLRAQANSKVVLIDGDSVLVSDLKLSGSPVKTYNYGQDILEYESEADAENLYNTMRVFLGILINKR